jgi:uncharacterized protein with NRDE domain
MCVLAFAWRAHPRWRLVMAGNRDELHARPAAPLARWEGPHAILAGRDLQSGGTWLGVSEEGRFAVITNLRGFGVAEPGRPSRGALVTDMLAGEGRYADPAIADLADFNAFNLITARPDEAVFRTNGPTPARHALTPGVYGLSNGALDEPWPKTVRITTILRDWLAAAAEHPEALLSGLREETLPAHGDLPVTPSDVPQEAPVSPIFILNPVYGTRCSTVVAIGEDGQGVIIERRFEPDGARSGETELRFSWPLHG